MSRVCFKILPAGGGGDEARVAVLKILESGCRTLYCFKSTFVFEIFS